MAENEILVQLKMAVRYCEDDGRWGWYVILETNAGTLLDAVGPFETEANATAAFDEAITNIRKARN